MACRMAGAVGLMSIQGDLTNCDKEPIHTPGAILPHGAMLVLHCDTYEILQAAGDTSGLLGRPLDALLEQRLETLLQPDQISLVHELCTEAPLTSPRHLLDPTLRVQANRPVD